jgi:translation initiation factor IF-2
VERAAKGLREPTFRQVWEGRAEVLVPIKIPRLGLIAGSRVQEGKVSRGDWIKLMRPQGAAGGRGARGGGAPAEPVWEGRVASLKHFKEDAREMVAGQECGIGLENFEGFEVGDVLECFRLEREEI